MPDALLDAPPPPTAPETFGVCVRDWHGEATPRGLTDHVGGFTRELSRYIDLSNLDGFTLGGDYPKALAELDRGYEITTVLTPSNDVAIGIAMTPSVIRGGRLKSHIVLNAGLAATLPADEQELFRFALHTLAHECAHVEVTAAFDHCFPNILLRSKRGDLREHCRWDVILACWDEYAACRISAGFGDAPTDGYEQTFIQALQAARDNAIGPVLAQREEGGIDPAAKYAVDRRDEVKIALVELGSDQSDFARASVGRVVAKRRSAEEDRWGSSG